VQYGLFFQLPRSAAQDTATRYRETLEQIELADRLGFDSAWLAEMHFIPEFSILPAPLLVCAAAAARTERIRLGVAVALLPLHDPIRAAEEAATLDVISGGRLDYGVGRGSIRAHFDGFGIPIAERAERFNEAIDVIRLAWLDDPVSYEGRYLHYDAVNVEPKPLQRPGPPLWMAANSDESIERAGREGWPAMVSPITATRPELVQRVATFRTLREKLDGEPPPAAELAWLTVVHVAEDGDQARREVHDSLMSYLDVVTNTGRNSRERAGRESAPKPTPVGRFAEISYEQILDEIAIVGSPAECREQLARVRDEFGVGHILTWFNAGGQVPNDKVQRSMRLWIDEVAPAFVDA